MKYKIQMVTETENGESVQEIACLEREMPEIPGIESVGITLAEAKALLLGIQQALVVHQVSAYLERLSIFGAMEPFCFRHKGATRFSA